MGKLKRHPAREEKRKRYQARQEKHRSTSVRRLEAQRAREAENRVRRANGEPTPWEAAQAERRARRAPLQRKGSPESELA